MTILRVTARYRLRPYRYRSNGPHAAHFSGDRLAASERAALASLLPRDGSVVSQRLKQPRLARCDRSTAPAAKARRIIFDDGRRSVASGVLDFKPSWPRCTDSRCPSRSPRGSRSRSFRARAEMLAPQTIKKIRRVGAGDLRDLPALRRDRRRHLHHSLAADRSRSITIGPYRSLNTGTTISADRRWLVADIRPGGGHREPAPARRAPSTGNSVSRSDRFAQWSAGFCRADFKASNSIEGHPVLYVNRPGGVSASLAARCCRGSRSGSTRGENEVLNDRRLQLASRSTSWPFKMQTSVPELVDLPMSPSTSLDLYGTKGADGTFAANACSRAGWPTGRAVHSALSSRLGSPWRHQGPDRRHRQKSDQACAALVTD